MYYTLPARVPLPFLPKASHASQTPTRPLAHTPIRPHADTSLPHADTPNRRHADTSPSLPPTYHGPAAAPLRSLSSPPESAPRRLSGSSRSKRCVHPLADRR